MSLSALASGVTLQRLFTWPLSSAALALGLGSLDQSVRSLPELLSGAQRDLITSHPLIRATLVEGDMKRYLIIVNRDATPHYANIRLSSSEVRPLGFLSSVSSNSDLGRDARPLRPLISASSDVELEGDAPSAVVSRAAESGPYLITVALNGWDAHIYDLSVTLLF